MPSVNNDHESLRPEEELTHEITRRRWWAGVFIWMGMWLLIGLGVLFAGWVREEFMAYSWFGVVALLIGLLPMFLFLGGIIGLPGS